MGSGGIKQTLNWDSRGGKALLLSWSECWIDGNLLFERTTTCHSSLEVTIKLLIFYVQMLNFKGNKHQPSIRLYGTVFPLKKAPALTLLDLGEGKQCCGKGQCPHDPIFANEDKLMTLRWNNQNDMNLKNLKSKKKSVCWHADGIVSTFVYQWQQVLPTQSGSKFNPQSRGAEESRAHALTLRYFFRSSICSLHCCWASKRVFM